MGSVTSICYCIDPRRIDPATGHYPGCPDDIIPPECLLPPHEVVTREERIYVGKGPRTARYPSGKPLYESRMKHELAPPKEVAVVPDLPAAPEVVVVLDTETTGLQKPIGICEIALAVVDLADGRVIAHHGKLLDPGQAISPMATAVHGIADADVAGALHLADVWPAVVAWVERLTGSASAEVIAHNAPYDRGAIEGVIPPADRPRWQWRCSMQLARKLAPGLPSYSLHDREGKVGLATSLGLARGTSHRALGDVQTTVSLLRALRARAGAWSTWRGDALVWGAVDSPKARGRRPASSTSLNLFSSRRSA